MTQQKVSWDFTEIETENRPRFFSFFPDYCLFNFSGEAIKRKKVRILLNTNEAIQQIRQTGTKDSVSAMLAWREY